MVNILLFQNRMAAQGKAVSAQRDKYLIRIVW